MMKGMTNDLLGALRSAIRRPLLTLVTVATLALAIGANTAIFSVIYAVLVRPLPYAEPGRLVTVWMDLTEQGGPIDEWASWDNFNDWRRLSGSFESMVSISGWRPTLAGRDGEPPEQLRGGVATADVFRVLGRSAALGRNFTVEEDRAQGARVVLLSSELFERRFASDEALLESTIQLDSSPVRVIGVLPPGFTLPFVGDVDVLGPMRVDATNTCGRGCVNQRVVGRLAPGVSLQQATSEMDAIGASLREQFPAANAGVGIHLQPLHDRVTGRVRTPLLLLLGAVGLMLLAACANVAGVQLARALARQEELALRAAIGASRGQLMRQLFAESLVLALLGGLAGLGLATLGLSLLGRLAAAAVPRLEQAGLDTPTLITTAVMTVLTGLLFGVAPALKAARFDLRSRLQESHGRSTVRMRRALVVAEVTIAMVLLIGTGLLGRSLLQLFRIDLGFEPGNALVARVALSTDEYREVERRVAFTETVLERLLALPGVSAAGHTNSPPLAGNDGDSDFQIEGRPEAEPGLEPVVWIRAVSPDFLRTAGIGVVAGRALDSADRNGGMDVVLVNEAAARRYWPDGNALGARINFNSTVRWRQVVGIVRDTRHFGLTEPARPAAYVPYAQSPFGSPYFVVRTDDRPLATVSALRTAVAEVDPALAVAEITTLDELVGNARATEQLLVALLALFAVSCVLLAAIGIYGVMSYVALQRSREMGVRQAIGASPRQVRGLLLRQGLSSALVGTCIGLVAALATTRAVRGLLFNIEVLDGVTWLSGPALLLAVMAAACWIPARRMSRQQLVTTLRGE